MHSDKGNITEMSLSTKLLINADKNNAFIGKMFAEILCSDYNR